MIVPASSTATTRTIVTLPVRMSTSTTTMCAPNGNEAAAAAMSMLAASRLPDSCS